MPLGNATASILRVETKREFADFDRLPPTLRDALNYSRGRFTATEVARGLAKGMSVERIAAAIESADARKYPRI